MSGASLSISCLGLGDRRGWRRAGIGSTSVCFATFHFPVRCDGSGALADVDGMTRYTGETQSVVKTANGNELKSTLMKASQKGWQSILGRMNR